MSNAAKSLKHKDFSQAVAKESRAPGKNGNWVEVSSSKVSISKSARQGAFREQSAGQSVKEVMAAARLIPDANPANFKILKICG